MIFVGSTGGRWTAASTATSRPSPATSTSPAALDRHGVAVEQDPSVLGHGRDRSGADRPPIGYGELVVLRELALRLRVEDVVAGGLGGRA